MVDECFASRLYFLLTVVIFHFHVTKNYLVSVQEAHDAIRRTIRTGKIIDMETADAFGYVLAQTVKSPYPSPLFDNSAMDGYAFQFDDYKKGKPVFTKGEASAGKNFNSRLKSGEAIRIFTGAAIPDGADTVVMQERIFLKEDQLLVRDEKLFKGANIRKAGSQIKKGVTAVEKGTYLNPGSISFIAALGVARLKVFSLPDVAIIVTGNELVSPGKKLLPGQIFESNSITLNALLRTDGIRNVKVYTANDTFDSTRKAFQKACTRHDFILFTGGISEGDYDFVGKVMAAERVRTLFYKVKQKPGKPLYFGSKSGKYIFGLPGNPASVISCYYEFVRPALQGYQNHPQRKAFTLQLPLSKSYSKKSGLTQFLKAYTDYRTVLPLPAQESYNVKSFVEANCFIMLGETTENINEGDIVEVHMI